MDLTCDPLGIISGGQYYATTAWSPLVQEAQLSQRDRAMLFVIEYFAKSLKVTRNDPLEQGRCKSLLVFHCNHVCISYRF